MERSATLGGDGVLQDSCSYEDCHRHERLVMVIFQQRRMKAETEELLYCLLWAADTILRPRMASIGESFESWACRRGVWREITELEDRKLLERRANSASDWSLELTEKGRLRALGGRDPQKRWERQWKGQWNLAAYDVPEAERSKRVQLHRALRRSGFGWLQKSLWITPDPLEEIILPSPALRNQVRGLITFVARPGLDVSDAAIVAAAWDFEEINAGYGKCLEIHGRAPELATASREEIQSWIRTEQAAWSAAVAEDPLLPTCLLPPDYLGKKVWDQRRAIVEKLLPAII